MTPAQFVLPEVSLSSKIALLNANYILFVSDVINHEPVAITIAVHYIYLEVTNEGGTAAQ